MLICVVLAGGRGTRLIPLTDTTPKPLLRAGDKTLLEWNMAGTAPFVDKFVIVVSYLGQQIIDRIGDSFLGKPVEYAWQQNPKGGTLDAFRTAIFESSANSEENQQADYLVIHADDIHGSLTWQNMQNKIVQNPQKAYLSGKIIEPHLAKSFGMFEVRQKISTVAIEKLEKELKNQNKEIVVDCLIQNLEGQILVQKRPATHHLFPNCWDLVGGHVDEGNTVLETLKQEIKEETDLEEFEVVGLIGQNNWMVPEKSQKDGDNPDKVILQFLVKAKNLDNLRLEKDKAVEFRWVSLGDDLEFLKENKIEDFYTFDLIKKALAGAELKPEFSEFEFVQIVEKPDYYVSNLANIAISYFPKQVLQFIPRKLENTGREAYITDLFNQYSQNFPIEVVPTEGSWLPVTSIEDLEKAREILKNTEAAPNFLV